MTEEKQIKEALQTAKNTKKVPTVIEFIIDREENVMPIVTPGKALNEMIIERKEKDNDKKTMHMPVC